LPPHEERDSEAAGPVMLGTNECSSQVEPGDTRAGMIHQKEKAPSQF